jgi:hypothetical protein
MIIDTKMPLRRDRGRPIFARPQRGQNEAFAGKTAEHFSPWQRIIRMHPF